MNILKIYDAALVKAPLRTKTATSFFIFGLCEFNAQVVTSDINGSKTTVLDRLSNVDWRQVTGYGCLAFYSAPMMHSFYNIALKRKWPLFFNIFANSFLLNPINVVAAMLFSNFNKNICAGQTLDQTSDSTVQAIQTNFLPTMQSSLIFWPLWHTLNWVLVSQRYRVFGFNIGSLCWNTYLTHTMWMIEKNRAVQPKSMIQESPSIVVPILSSPPLLTFKNQQDSNVENQTEWNDLKEFIQLLYLS